MTNFNNHYTSGKSTHFFGSICKKHPELKGKRYRHRYRCIKCFAESVKKRKEDVPKKYQIWFEQKGKCAGCKIDICSEHATLDHIKAIADGGTNDRSNLQVLCFKCNTYKHDKEKGQWEHRIKPIVWYKDLVKEEPQSEINPC